MACDGEPLALKVVEETAAFLLTDLRTAEGGFASSLDADTDGVEGLTYVWTPAQLQEVLGPEDGARAATTFLVTGTGSFEHGTSTAQLSPDADLDWVAGVRARLRAARDLRPQPGRDDKVVTSWNGLAVAALAEAGALLDRPEWVGGRGRVRRVRPRHPPRRRPAEASLPHRAGGCRVGGRGRPRQPRRGAARAAPGDGRAALALGRRVLLESAVTLFAAEDGGFHDTSVDAEPLYLRPRSGADNAEPSGQSALAGALSRSRRSPGRRPPRRPAASPRRPAPGSPSGSRGSVAGLSPSPKPSPTDAPGRRRRGRARGLALARAARRSTAPGLVVVHGQPDADGVPLLAERPLVGGQPAAYVCRGFVCDLPVTSPDDLTAQLGTS